MNVGESERQKLGSLKSSQQAFVHCRVCYNDNLLTSYSRPNKNEPLMASGLPPGGTLLFCVRGTPPWDMQSNADDN